MLFAEIAMPEGNGRITEIEFQDLMLFSMFLAITDMENWIQTNNSLFSFIPRELTQGCTNPLTWA